MATPWLTVDKNNHKNVILKIKYFSQVLMLSLFFLSTTFKLHKNILYTRVISAIV